MIKIGTCSWKYDSWKGIIYPDKKDINYLKEYAETFDTVEVDQWFWSLFGREKISLPERHDVEAYKLSVDDKFLFSIKMPNSISLTHFYNKNKNEQLKENPYFLSEELTGEFLKTLKPLENNLGPLMFQFEYLNKNKMPDQQNFQIQFGNFIDKLDKKFMWALEIRNPDYLNKSYFEFLKEYKIIPVFLQGYYMPDVTELIKKYTDYLDSTVVIRLHGPDRKGIEAKSGGNWNKIIEPKDDELKRLINVILKLHSKEVDIYLNVNNHYEGSAPLTIEKINHQLNSGE